MVDNIIYAISKCIYGKTYNSWHNMSDSLFKIRIEKDSTFKANKIEIDNKILLLNEKPFMVIYEKFLNPDYYIILKFLSKEMVMSNNEILKYRSEIINHV